MSIGSQQAMQKMRAGTLGGQARVAQPTAFPQGQQQRKKRAVSRGLRAVYDASDASTYTLDSNGRVMNCLDKSGTQRHLIAPPNAWFNTTPLAVDACRPLLLPGDKNGLNTFSFSRNNSNAHDVLYRRDRSSFNFLHRGPATVFLVTKPLVTVGGGNRNLVISTTYFNSGTWPNGDTGYELEYFPNEFVAGQDFFQTFVINNQQGGNETTVSVTSQTYTHTPSPTWHIIVVLTSPTDVVLSRRGRMYLDGSNTPGSVNTNSGTTTGIDSAGFFGISGTMTDRYNGSIPPADTTPVGGGLQVFAEARIYEGLLPDYDWMTERDELNAKWQVY